MSVLKRMPLVGNPPQSGQVLRLRRQPGHYVDQSEPVADIYVGGDLVTLLAPEAGKVLTSLTPHERVDPGDPVFEITGVGTPTYELFVAYRQADSAGHAGRLGDNLIKDFGRGQVFKDVESLPLGVDFVAHIRAMLERAAAMVIVIGPQWLILRDAAGPRIHSEEDLHREEIRTALERGIPIFPTLVNGARMPSAAELPADIRSLATKYAVEIRDRNWDADVAPLSAAVARALASSPRRQAFLSQVEIHDPRRRTGPGVQWITDDPFKATPATRAESRVKTVAFALEWGQHSNGITVRGRNRSPDILRAVRCSIVGVERFVGELEMFVKDPAHYPADVFPPLALTGQQDLGNDDAADFGFIHLQESRLVVQGQNGQLDLRRSGIWRINCLVEHSNGMVLEGSLCLSWVGAGRKPEGINECPQEGSGS